ncbi:hypothetical protein SESBI_18355 [Sesbania bispinosa]|nr:hypothetical protein SESBI_18355 [Sesbania bispinosa]
MASARYEPDRAAGRTPRVEEQTCSWGREKCSRGLCFPRMAQMHSMRVRGDRTVGSSSRSLRVDQLTRLILRVESWHATVLWTVQMRPRLLVQDLMAKNSTFELKPLLKRWEKLKSQ